MSSRKNILSRVESGDLTADKLTERQRELLAFIEKQSEGVSGKQICSAHDIWLDALCDHLAPLRHLGLIVRCGYGRFSLYASAENAPAVLAKMEEHRDGMRIRKNRKRSERRKRKEDESVRRFTTVHQIQISAADAKPLQKIGPASVFELSAFA